MPNVLKHVVCVTIDKFSPIAKFTEADESGYISDG